MCRCFKIIKKMNLSRDFKHAESPRRPAQGIAQISRADSGGFCRRRGFDYKHYQSIETGKKRDPRLSTMDRLAKAYGISGRQLVGLQFPKTKFRRAHSRGGPVKDGS